MASEAQSALLLDGAARESTLTAFRYANYDVPFWTRPNSRDGRWNRAGDAPTQYWALCPDAAWAELIRWEGLTTEAELDEVRMSLWVCRVPRLGLLDLRDPGDQERWRLTDELMTADDHAATQVAAIRMRDQVPGIIAPSAALPGHGNVTLFGPRRAIDWHSRPALASTLPTTRAAIGRPPPGLLKLVRRPAPGPQDRLF